MGLVCWGHVCERDGTQECPDCKLLLCADCFARDTQHASDCRTGRRLRDHVLAAEADRQYRAFRRAGLGSAD